MSSAAHLRNTAAVQQHARAHYERAVRSGLMRVSLKARDGRRVQLPDGAWVTEFINCSYLGLDVDPAVVRRAQDVLPDWGVHLCCARSRFSIGPLEQLEEGLSELWQARAITFPSVTSTHMSTMPLLPSIWAPGRRAAFLYDRFAHASMQYLRPVLAAEHHVEVVPHNDLAALEAAVHAAQGRGEFPIYVADGVYSMGGVCPVRDVVALASRLGFALYLDDAHGTSIFGARGQGYVLDVLGGPLPSNVVLAFSLGKGFGCNGGGVLLPTREAEALVRTFGMTYGFSAPLDFSIVGAALAALEVHRSPRLAELQARLRRTVALYDELVGRSPPFSPIRMVEVGSEERALSLAEALKAKGHFVSATFFPIVPKGAAMLRICLGVGHDDEAVRALAADLRALGAA